MAERIDIRLLAARDSLDAVTDLLHRAYASLAAQGMNVAAATQTVATTQLRIAEGQCFVAGQRGRIVGTITVCGPPALHTAAPGAGVPAFRDRDTAHFHQFAVAPDLQRLGLGRRLLAACEQWARERGYRRMSLEASESAAALRGLCHGLGYGDVAPARDGAIGARNAVMEKPLDRSPLRDHLRLLARYNRRATQALLQQVEAVPAAIGRPCPELDRALMLVQENP